MQDQLNSDEKEISPDQMLIAVSELLVSTRSYQNRHDRHYANELVGQIIEAMPDKTKVKAADFLARLSEPPESLLRQLVFHSGEAAKRILGARHVTDAVLMEAASKSLELRKIVAQRSQLTEPVVNRLLFHEEPEIEDVILPRRDVTISSNRAARLIDRAEGNEKLGLLIAKRSDLTPRLSLRLFWNVRGDARTIILKRFNIDPRFAAEIFMQMLKKSGGGGGALADLARLVAEVSEGEVKSTGGDHGLARDLTAFRQACGGEAVQRVADRARISFAIAERVASDVPGDAFAILCKALGIDEKTFVKLSAVKPSKPVGTVPFSNDDRIRMKEVYGMIPRSAAIAVLSYWEIDRLEQEQAAAEKEWAGDVAAMKARLSQEFAQGGDASSPAEASAKKRFRLFGG